MNIGLKRLSGLILAGVVLFAFASTEAMAKKKSYKKSKKVKKSKRSKRSKKINVTTEKTKDGVYVGGNLAYVIPGDVVMSGSIGAIEFETTKALKSSLGISAVVGYKKQDMAMQLICFMSLYGLN